MRVMTQLIQVYAGTAGHSAWFSEDLGESWVHPNSHSGLSLEARVWCIASHPAMPALLYAGTDMGIFRWDEGPARWTLLPSPMQDVWSVIQDPRDPAVLFAGTRPAGFYRSGDGGASWTQLEAPGLSQFSTQNMGPTRVTQMLFHPLDPDILWATVEIGGIYRSTDRGRSWQLFDAGLVSADVHGIAAVEDEDGRLALLATTNRGLHRSSDGGATWQFQELDSPWQYTRAVVTRADDRRTVFLTNGNGPPGNDGRLLRSRDGGLSWRDMVLPGALNSTPWCVATHPADPQLIFACTNLGQLFRSRDGGDSWQRLPHEFGELRALHWRPLPAGLDRQPHSVTRRTVKRPETV
jgi:photosystem II stability/assembly factor-like uncharacterized protein